MDTLPATSEVFEKMRGLQFTPRAGEGVVYIKLVALKPETIASGDPAATTSNAQGVVCCGKLTEIKAQFNQWLDALIAQYQS